MKKLIYTLTAIATLAFAAGCANELDGPNPVKGEFVETEFTVALDDAVATKAINNDGKQVDKLVICAFRNDGTYLPELNETNGNFEISAIALEGTKPQFSVKAKLVRNYPYKLAFFAYKNGAPYALSSDGGSPVITMTAASANDESLDAFFFVTDDEHPVTLDPDAPASLAQTFTLSRPLAQINVLSDPADWAAATATGILTGLKSSVSIAKAPNALNLVNGAVSGEATLAFTLAEAPTGAINVAAPEAAAVNANYVAMCYVLSSEAANPVDVTFSVSSDAAGFGGFTREVKNVPNKRNFRTNLHGDIFTTTGDFTVELEGTWGGSDSNQSINIPTPTVDPLALPSGYSGSAVLPTVNPGNNVTTTVGETDLYFGLSTNSDGAVTYTSTHTEVGTVSAAGEFHAVGSGDTDIIVHQEAGKQTKAVGDDLADITIVYHVHVDAAVVPTYAITKAEVSNGTLAVKVGDAEVTEAAEGATITVVATPAEGYQLVALTYTPAEGEAVDIKSTGSFTMPAKAVFVAASFTEVVVTPATYTVTVGTLAGGEIAATPASGVENTEITLTVTPAEGKQLKAGTLKYTPEGGEAVAINETTKKFNLPAANVTVSAEFEDIPATVYTITIEGSGLTSDKSSAAEGETVTLTVIPAANNRLKDLTVLDGDGENVELSGTGNTRTFSMPASNVEAEATFEEFYTVTVTQPAGGTISLKNGDEAIALTDNVASGIAENTVVTLVATPSSGYVFDSWTVKDADNGTVTVTDNQFTMPAKNVTVTAVYKRISVISYDTMTAAGQTLNSAATTESATKTVDGLSITYNGISTNGKNTPTASGATTDAEKPGANQLILLKKSGSGTIKNASELSGLSKLVVVVTGTTTSATSATKFLVKAGSLENSLSAIDLPSPDKSSEKFKAASGSAGVDVNIFTYEFDLSSYSFFEVYSDSNQVDVKSITVVY